MSAKYHTFLSHNSDDKLAVEQLAHQLRKEGVEPWLDKWNLIPGNPWQEEIEQALEECGTCCVFLSQSGVGPWQNAEMRAAINRRITKNDFRVIPVLLPGAQREQRSQYPTFLTQTTWVEFRETLDDQNSFRRLVAGIRGIAPGPDAEFVPDQNIIPYRGLQIFDIEHARYFFGREALTEWIIEALRSQLSQNQSNRFLAIIGASGSGKSSIARAGVIPALSQGALPGSEEWPAVIFKPGPNPIESLAIALKRNEITGVDISDVGDLNKHLAQNTDRLHLQSRLAIGGQQEQNRLIVLVDQFEEVFTLCHEDHLRQAFINSLLYAATEAMGPTIVIITMRADFYGKCAAHDDLAKALSDHQMLIGPMSDQELRDAIVRPAQLTGCEFESGLVEMLIEDVKGEAGALPLLEYALVQLWNKRDGRRLTVKTYNSMGKLEGALERRANEIYDHLDLSEQDICKQIFLRLTQPGEGTEDTKRRAYRSEIGYKKNIEKVLKTLADERLITTEGKTEDAESLVEVSHEALIRGWSKLRKWIDENRDNLRIQARLMETIREWDRVGRANLEDFVYRGARLVELEEWANRSNTQLSDLEREFLEASVQSRDKQIQRKRRIQRQTVLILLVLFLIVGSVIGTAFTQWREMQRTHQQLAEIQKAKEKEVARTDISGALIVFSTSYGDIAMEGQGRGKFTDLVEERLFEEYVSVSSAVAQVQEQLIGQYSRYGKGQRAEVLSSLNGEIYLQPRNNSRQFFALVTGTDYYEYEDFPGLTGSIADARSIHQKLVDAGYDSTLLVNPPLISLRVEIDNLLKRATEGCIRHPGKSMHQGSMRGIASPLEPCDNIAIFLYFAGRGFVDTGTNYLLLKDNKMPEKRENISDYNYISIENLRARLARDVGIQIIISDICRSPLLFGKR